jgi:hypothetical protein
VIIKFETISSANVETSYRRLVSTPQLGKYLFLTCQFFIFKAVHVGSGIKSMSEGIVEVNNNDTKETADTESETALSEGRMYLSIRKLTACSGRGYHNYTDKKEQYGSAKYL